MSLFWIKLSVLLSVHDLFTHSNTLYNITIGIDTFGIHADTFSLTSGTSTIHIQEVHIGKTLTAYSAAGKIFCQLSGKASDCDIDCPGRSKGYTAANLSIECRFRKKDYIAFGHVRPETFFYGLTRISEF